MLLTEHGFISHCKIPGAHKAITGCYRFMTLTLQLSVQVTSGKL